MIINQIWGGIVVNMIFELCEFIYEFCNLFGMSVVDIQVQIDKYIVEVLLFKMCSEFLDVCVEIDNFVGSLVLEVVEQVVIIELVCVLMGDCEICKVVYGIEVGLFQQIGILIIVCGFGDIGNVYKFNEFVILFQMECCEQFLCKLGKLLQLV